MVRFLIAFAVAAAWSASAAASSSTFNGTASADTITVGEWWDTSTSKWYYVACVNSTWYTQGQVTGSSDTVTISAGAGNDSVTIVRVQTSVNCGGTPRTVEKICYAAACPASGNVEIYGEAGIDTINGGDPGEYISGGDNGDTINGYGGNDYIDGGLGDDVLRGSGGNDALDGGGGSDDVYGENGDDFVYGGDGTTDDLDGGAGNDCLDDSTGQTTCECGDGASDSEACTGTNGTNCEYHVGACFGF